jgi:hypothetical protein
MLCIFGHNFVFVFNFILFEGDFNVGTLAT